MKTRTGLRWLSVILLLAVAGCAARGPAPVSPDEIPALRQRIGVDPTDGDAMLRLAAALFADGRCEEAAPIAEQGRLLRPRDPLGPLVIGQCLEQAERFADAADEYARFLERWPDAPGAAAIRAREHTALRSLAAQEARRALANEAQLAGDPGDPATVAVLPLLVTGHSTYAPLARGLAALITADLDLLDRVRLVERMQIDALLDELELVRAQLVDPATGARLGSLVRAGRMIQGTADIRETGLARLEAAVVSAADDVQRTDAESGRLENLLRLQKELVISVAEALGPPLTLAERTRILNNGTQNVLAFLAYSRGLEAEWVGNYGAAVSHFADAIRADPGFTQARERRSLAAAVEVVATASPDEVTTVAGEADRAAGEAQGVTPTLGNVFANAVSDVASTQSERATTAAGDPTGNQQLNQLTGTPSSGVTPGIERLPVEVIIRILIPIPR